MDCQGPLHRYPEGLRKIPLGYLGGLPETPLKDVEEIYRTSLRIARGPI
jgi:hypothetical protein